jgi:glutaredoxin
MFIIRIIIGKLLLLVNELTQPKPLIRTKEEQEKVDLLTKSFKLYQYNACPFCIKVRRMIAKYSLNIDLADAKKDLNKMTLQKYGGKVKVPCLNIPVKNGKDLWLYESEDIIKYIKKNLNIT